MIVERSEHPDWLSNTFIAVDAPGGSAVMIDAGGPVRPLLERLAELEATLEAVILTHHHFDHVAELAAVTRAYPDAPVLVNPVERDLITAMNIESLAADAIAYENLTPGQIVTFGGLELEAIHTPGHTVGMLALLLNGEQVFTGDTLFKGSVGGVRAPGHTTFEDLRSSVMDVLLALPAETVIQPGHSEPTTVGAELESNSFARIWQGLDPEGTGSCKVGGEPADLILLGPDYDGGHKAWVRWPDGSDDLVPGSIVEAD